MPEKTNSEEATDDRTKVHLKTRVSIIGAVMGLAMLFSVDPVLAQESEMCQNPLIETLENGMLFLTLFGPMVGVANAGWNMTKAAGTNKSGKKKEYKENIQSGLLYGMAVGMLFAIGGLITSWGPVSMC